MESSSHRNDAEIDITVGYPLSEAHLLSICHASPDEPVRENGLTIRQVKRPRASPTSPYLTPFPKASTSTDTVNETLLPPVDRSGPVPGTKAFKRASSISILSGLGVQIPDDPAIASAVPAEESPSKSPSKKAKLRNFFGQRPPSELITTHLSEYFPFTEKKVLERTRRQSMMRNPLANRRDSIISLNPAAQSRFSMSPQGFGTRGSARNSVASRMSVASSLRPISPPPPIPDSSSTPPSVSISNEDGRQLDASQEPGTSRESKRMSRPQLLPPVAISSESLSESLNLGSGSRPGSRLSVASSKRMSYIQELRSKRDVSDTASMMTVDEITAEVESRQDDIGSKDPSSDDTEEWTAVESSDADTQSIKEVPEDEREEEEEEYEEEEEEEEEEYEEEEEDGTEATLTDEDETGKAITSRGGMFKSLSTTFCVNIHGLFAEKTIKWIKGALIGSGSFGKVYLGMDAASGLLMAVKQVELPSGTAPNEERKKSMLSALEHEIELLKDLHHENIVQYLCK